MKLDVRWIILAAELVAAVGLFIVVRPASEPDQGPASSATASETPWWELQLAKVGQWRPPSRGFAIYCSRITSHHVGCW